MGTPNRATVLLLYWLSAVLTTAGCAVPARVGWSPDGSTGTYQVDGRALLIDREGQVLADLGESVAGFCWSADSRQLYVATLEADDGTAALTEVRRDWLKDSPATPGTTPGASMLEAQAAAPPPATAPTTRDSQGRQPLEYMRLTVSVRRDGKTTPLFRVRTACPEARLLVSPDGSWLVVGTSLGNIPLPGLAMPDLYAFSLRSGRLFAVTPWVAYACFTGPDRLAFARCAAVSDLALGLYAVLFEATLAEDQPPAENGPPNARALLELLPLWTGAVHPIEHDLLLTAARREFPQPLRDGEPDLTRPFQLYRWSRNTRRLSAIARNAGPWFLPSPGGRRILFETRRAKAGERATRALAIMRSDGGDRWTLRAEGVPVDDEHFAFGAMEPGWRGDDHVVLAGPSAEAPPPAPGDEGRTRYDVTLYRLAPRGRLVRVRTLSRAWQPTVKPYTPGPWLGNRSLTRPARGESRPAP